jgi:hypothetical protein
MRETTVFLAGTTVGAGLVYALDPARRGRRWALVRDQVTHARRKTRDAADATARDMTNRMRGLTAEVRSLFEPGEAPDPVLVERVRAKLGHWTSHPRAVDVTARDGCVTLRGPILATERDGMVRAVRRVRGVREVVDQLASHAQTEQLSTLQGGVPRAGERFELFQTRWSPTARVLVGAAGTAAAVIGLRRGTFAGGLMVAAGGLMLARAATNASLERLAERVPRPSTRLSASRTA